MNSIPGMICFFTYMYNIILELYSSCLGFDFGANMRENRYHSKGEMNSNVQIFKHFYNFETPDTH